MTTRVLDRKKFFDPRSRAFGIAATTEPLPPIVKKTWGYPKGRLDQGAEGHCVGFGWSNELAGDPVRIGPVDDAFAHAMFYAAQTEDRKMGNNWSDGASVLAGAKAVKSLGYIEEYRWAFGIDEVLHALMTGPVVLGVDWYDGMYETDKRGLVNVSGSVVGGHCITSFGFIPKMRFGLKRIDVVPWVQSWGLGYGRRGIGYLPVEQLATLLSAGGEACVPVHRLRPRR
jgi:hypothetical protein